MTYTDDGARHEPVASRAAVPPDSADVLGIRTGVQFELDRFIARQREVLAELGPAMVDLVDAVAALLRGGKRLRAAFLYWGYRAAGGAHHDPLVRAASAMEILQAAALVHDDVMDDSDLRRGRPAAHRQFAEQHEGHRWSGSPEEFGRAAAILAGDLALVWSDEALTHAGLDPVELGRARGVFDVMRTQLMGGQFLDIRESMRDWDALDHHERVQQCLTVIRYKSAKYSIEQPLLIGAAAAGADTGQLTALSAYGLALGEAFQLRDDVLGVFGDPSETGKPAGDDIREGKRTLLIAEALHTADEFDRGVIGRDLGEKSLDELGVHRMREILVRTGAVDRVEAQIQDGADRAIGHLDVTTGLTSVGRQALTELIGIATRRET